MHSDFGLLTQDESSPLVIESFLSFAHRLFLSKDPAPLVAVFQSSNTWVSLFLIGKTGWPTDSAPTSVFTDSKRYSRATSPVSDLTFYIRGI